MSNETKPNSTTLSEVFSLFYGTDEMRPAFLNPFVNGEYIYATDAYSLVRCKNEHIDFEYKQDDSIKKPDAEKVIPEATMSEILNIDSIDWISLMKSDETIGDGNDIECGHCKGNGSVEDDFLYKGKFYKFEYECPVCDGSGYEEEEKLIPTGKKTFGSGDRIKLKNSIFNARKFYKLKLVKDLIGGDVELLSISNTKAYFRIGFVEILIMAVLTESDFKVIAEIN